MSGNAGSKHAQKGIQNGTEWIEMSKDEFITKMVTLGVKYREGLFPNGAWKQEGSVLSAYIGNVLVGQYDEATGRGWVM